MRTYIFSGLSGALLYTITGTNPFDPWAEVEGDTDDDGDVDERDEQTVMNNLGLSGEPGTLSKAQGDLNADGFTPPPDIDSPSFTLYRRNWIRGKWTENNIIVESLNRLKYNG